MDLDVLIFRYLVEQIVDGNKSIVCSTNDLDIANNHYESTVDKATESTSHFVVYIFDYDKNTNINYFDNKDDTY